MLPMKFQRPMSSNTHIPKRSYSGNVFPERVVCLRTTHGKKKKKRVEASTTHHQTREPAEDRVQQAADRPRRGEVEEHHHHPEHADQPKAEGPHYQVQRAAEADAAPPQEQRRRRQHKGRHRHERNHLRREGVENGVVTSQVHGFHRGGRESCSVYVCRMLLLWWKQNNYLPRQLSPIYLHQGF